MTSIIPPSTAEATNDMTAPVNYEPILGYKRIVLAVGNDTPLPSCKTAMSLLRYRLSDCLAVIDEVHAGKRAQERFGMGGEVPIVHSLEQTPDADALFIGIAAAGGKLPAALRGVIYEAIRRGLDVVSGLHDFLIADAELRNLAKQTGSRLIDVRRNSYQEPAQAISFRPECLRIHAVGHDCSVGKMVTTLELEQGLQARGQDAKFLATGQTGIMIVGNGVPVDCVVSDFVNGAVENLVDQHQHHDILLVEGQGSITHPSFSAVTLGLLHGCAPQGLILCYEAGRTHVKGLPHVPLSSLERYRELYETLASERCAAQVIGVAMNGRYLTPDQAEQELQQIRDRLGLPACDVYRDGPETLVEAVLQFKESLSL